MADDENRKTETDVAPEHRDVVWNVVPDEAELADFKKRYRRRLIIHLCTALIAAILFGFIAYSDLFTPPATKPESRFVKTLVVPVQEPVKAAEEKKDSAADPLEKIRNAVAEAKDKAALETQLTELSSLLKGELKDDPAALKLHFELTEKIRAAEQKK